MVAKTHKYCRSDHCTLAATMSIDCNFLQSSTINNCDRGSLQSSAMNNFDLDFLQSWTITHLDLPINRCFQINGVCFLAAPLHTNMPAHMWDRCVLPAVTMRRCCKSNWECKPVTVYWHWVNTSQHWYHHPSRLAGQPQECQIFTWLIWLDQDMNPWPSALELDTFTTGRQDSLMESHHIRWYQNLTQKSHRFPLKWNLTKYGSIRTWHRNPTIFPSNGI